MASALNPNTRVDVLVRRTRTTAAEGASLLSKTKCESASLVGNRKESTSDWLPCNSTLPQSSRRSKDAIVSIRRRSRDPMSVDELCVISDGPALLCWDLADWAAFGGLVISIPSLKELRFLQVDRLPCSAILPASFLLLLRQHCFSLHLGLSHDDEPKESLATLLYQNRQIYYPLISPFAIRAILLDSTLHFSNIWAILQLGRAGPEKIALDWYDLFFSERDGCSIDKLLSLMQRSYWVRWQFDILHLFKEDVTGENRSDYDPEAYIDEEDLKLAKRIDKLNRRNRSLSSTTKTAAAVLLRAARPLLFPQPLDSPECHISYPHTSSSSGFSSTQLLPTSGLGHTLSIFSNFQPCGISPLITPLSPVFSIPYEILDLILSYLSPGHLSSKQHRLVMNWAEDRSTLVGSDKAESRTDFLRRTNCMRWDSELEEVNLGID